MSRIAGNLGNGRGSGGNHRSASQMVKDRLLGKSNVGPKAKVDTQTLMEQKMQQMRDRYLHEGKSKGFMLPGTKQDDKQLSAAAQKALQQVAEYQAQKAAKRRKRYGAEVEVKSAYIPGPQGGRIDARGNVYGPDNRVILKIDLKTGRIKNGWGMAVGKYDPNGKGNMFKMSQLVTKYGGPVKNFWGVPGQAPTQAWGGAPTIAPPGSDDNNGW